MDKLIMVATGLVLCGCSTMPVKKVDANAWAKDYYNQPRSSDLITLKGKAMTITLANVDELTISTQLPIISVIPREPSWMDSVSSIIPTLGLAWMGINAINKGPTVVNQPQPLVVEPMIVRP